MGCSHLGIMMTRRNDWFRHADLNDFFEELKASEFFNRFSDVVFYGNSMGGYGACAYSSAAPGSRVVVFSPQTSLCPSIVPWETRYRSGFSRGDWSGPRSDAAREALKASSVQVIYDPYYTVDRLHVDRFARENLTLLHCPWLGHKAARGLHNMGVLKPLAKMALEGTLTQKEFRLCLSNRHASKLYVREIIKCALDRGHPKMAHRLVEKMTDEHGWAFPALRKDIKRAIANAET
jgi:pimeloyl-ACP methyl ester carboxylesterase